MNFPKIFERVYLRPLSLTPARFLAMHQLLLPRLRAERPFLSAEEISALKPKAEAYRPPEQFPARNSMGQRRRAIAPDAKGRLYTLAAPGVAVVPMFGTLGKNLDAMDMMCGGVDYDSVAAAFSQAMDDETVSAIILDVDSPGGEVTGCGELAVLVRAGAQEKKIVAYCDSEMCSAAYYVGSQAGEIVCTPSSSIGAVGCYIAFLDQSVRMETEGLAMEVIKSGEFKGMGAQGTSLSDSHRAFLQNWVDQSNAAFAGAVQSARPGVKAEDLQGQFFSGGDAVRNGLADATVGSFDELLALLGLKL